MRQQRRDHADGLVGRDRELRESGEVVDQALAGAGGLLLVAGEAGVGKSHLVQALAARTSARTVTGLCWDDAGTPPFWPWATVLRDSARAFDVRLGPELAPVLGDGDDSAGPAEQLRLRLFDAVATHLTTVARTEPVLIVLEDLHAADHASLDLLRYVASSLRGRPVAIVGTHRYPDLEPGTPFEVALAELSRAGRTVTLRGLDADGVADLIRQTTGAPPSGLLVERIGERTGGNPLFVTEVARLLAIRGDDDPAALPIPKSVQQVIGQRLGYVRRAVHDVLRHAAVIGQVFDLELLAHVTGERPQRIADVLDEAIATGLVTRRAVPGNYAFTHALVRDVLDASSPAADRRTHHLLVAEAMEVRYGQNLDDHLDALADHHLLALPDADEAKTLAYVRRAGEQALRRLAYDRAARRFEEGAELATQAGTDESVRVELLLALADARLRAGDWDAASETYEAVAASARRRGRPDELARAALGLGAGLSGFEVRLFDQRQLDLLREALDALGEKDPELRAWLLARLSVAESYLAGPEVRVAHSEEALKLARRSGDLKLLAYALSSYCDAIPGPEHTERRLKSADEMVQLGIEARDAESELLGRRFRVVALLESGELAAAEAEAKAFEQTATRLRWPLVEWYPVAWRAMRALVEGRLDDANRLADEAKQIGRRGGSINAVLAADSQHLRADLERGRPHDAYARLESFLEDPEGGPNSEPSVVFLLAQMGRDAEARAVLHRLVAADFPLHRDTVWMEVIGLVAEGAVALGEVEAARRLLELIEPFADRFATGTSVGAVCLGSMSLPLGLLATCLERWDDADAWFRRALAAHRRAGATLLVAHTLRHHAEMLRARGASGDVVAAGALQHEADAIYEQLGLEQWAGARAAPRRATPDGDEAAAPAVEEDVYVFQRDGETWRVRYDGRETRVRDSKGLATLARLLAEPGRELHVFDLIEGGGRDERFAAARHTGEVIDAQARDAYKRRLDELEAELDAAQLTGDQARSERAQSERDALVDQLTAAYGLGGRTRRGNDPVERARSTVTKRIRGAIARIEPAHPTLARHLDNAVKTGRYCSYDPERPVSWQV